MVRAPQPVTNECFHPQGWLFPPLTKALVSARCLRPTVKPWVLRAQDMVLPLGSVWSMDSGAGLPLASRAEEMPP